MAIVCALDAEIIEVMDSSPAGEYNIKTVATIPDVSTGNSRFTESRDVLLAADRDDNDDDVPISDTESMIPDASRDDDDDDDEDGGDVEDEDDNDDAFQPGDHSDEGDDEDDADFNLEEETRRRNTQQKPRHATIDKNVAKSKPRVNLKPSRLSWKDRVARSLEIRCSTDFVVPRSLTRRSGSKRNGVWEDEVPSQVSRFHE